MHGEVQIRFWEGLRKPASATGEQPVKKSLTGEFVRAAALATLIIFSDMRLRIVRAQGAPGFRGCGTLIRQTIDHVLGLNLPDETKQARPGGNLRRVLGYE